MLSYKTVTEVGDFGAKIVKLICHLPQPVQIGQVKPEKFSVFVARRGPDGAVLQLASFPSRQIAPAQGYRTVTAAYPSDESGAACSVGDWLTLELDPNDPQAAAYATITQMNEFVTCDYRVTQVAPVGALTGLVFDEYLGDLCPQTARWQNSAYTGGGYTLNYGYFTPDAAGERPLLIWLHGMGEGGTDPRVAYMGNNVVNLSGETIQGYFGGAYVLAPQAPTFWMDDGSGTIELGRTGSIYEAALNGLIDEFIATHPVDRSRVYLGGCSNGGFMTMVLLRDRPGTFAAAYPMCQALADSCISDAEIQTLAQENIWFVHAMSDNVVDPEKTSVPTYRRLQAAGAKNVHFAYINDRPPFPTYGHFCWVPGLAGRVAEDFDGRPVMVAGKPANLFQWLAAQKLAK